MEQKSIDDLLLSIENGLINLSESRPIIDAINQFQPDPLILDKSMPRYIELLTKQFFVSSQQQMSDIGDIFYNFSKVCTVKKVMRHLSTDIFLLPMLVKLLKENNQSTSDWHTEYLVLAWINIIIMSPFKLDNDRELYELTLPYKTSQVLHPIVSSLQSELFIRNKELFYDNINVHGLDLLTVNATLKLVASNQHKLDKFIDPQLLQRITKYCLEEFHHSNELEGLLILKILPKLCNLHILEENWGSVEDIISWILNNLDSPFTELRFKLARNFGKIVTLIKKYADDMAQELVELCICDVVSLLKDKARETIDSDTLHSYLLIIAEFSRFKLIPDNLLKNLVKDIIPHTIKFQQLRIAHIQGHLVRDATNFICWSLARNYESSDDITRKIFVNLLMCSMFDHDLVIRRSANAALQEVLGRGAQYFLDNDTTMKIIELPVGNLTASYLENTIRLCEVFSGSHPAYTEFMIEWLLDYNVAQNYDLHIVKLTCQTLRKLFFDNKKSSQYMKIDEIDKRLFTIMESLGKNMTESQDIIACCRFSYMTAELGLDNIGEVNEKIPFLAEKAFKRITETKFGRATSPTESFKIMSFLKYLNARLVNNDSHLAFELNSSVVNKIFQAVRYFSDSDKNYSEVKNLFIPIVSTISSLDTISIQPADYELFWTTYYRFIKFNNHLCCSALPCINPIQFTDLFHELMPLLSCASKSQLLNSLSERLNGVVSVDISLRNRLVYSIVELLDDYTISEQGDIGRLVRTSAILLIKRHRTIFINDDENLKTKVCLKLLRLSGEPLDTLRRYSFSILCETFGLKFEENREINPQILEFYHTYFPKSREFWEGYLMSAGAIHSTDKQITSAVNSFLLYYNQLTNEEKLDLCNELVRIIPTAKVIQTMGRSTISKNSLGCPQRDIIKTTLTLLTFWQRILESNIQIDNKFNFQGVYAKFYNLHLLNCSPRLKTAVVRLFPLLAINYTTTNGNGDKGFVNNIIRRLWKLANSPTSKKEFTQLHRTSLEGLVQVFLEFRQEQKVALLRERSLNKDTLKTVKETDLLI